MENGRTKQIARIRTGDKVEAGDPDTGRHKGPREVTATWINDDRDLVDVTIQDSDGRPATLHTTSRHPFWDDTLHAWTAAAQLRAGDALNTDKNFHATVLSVRATPGAANRYNLTVDDLHTYYVRACETPILVHNTGPDVTCSIGDHGYESIPARSKGGNWTKQEIDQNDANGYSFGCHTCGVVTPGTPKGNWVLDHQPPSQWVPNRFQQRLFPQCASCSSSQGWWVRRMAPVMRQLYQAARDQGGGQ